MHAHVRAIVFVRVCMRWVHMRLRADAKSERSRRQDCEFVHRARELEMQQALEEAQLGRAEGLLRQKEEHEAALRALQVRAVRCRLQDIALGSWLAA